MLRMKTGYQALFRLLYCSLYKSMIFIMYDILNIIQYVHIVQTRTNKIKCYACAQSEAYSESVYEFPKQV